MVDRSPTMMDWCMNHLAFLHQGQQQLVLLHHSHMDEHHCHSQLSHKAWPSHPPTKRRDHWLVEFHCNGDKELMILRPNTLICSCISWCLSSCILCVECICILPYFVLVCTRLPHWSTKVPTPTSCRSKSTTGTSYFS